MSSKPIQFAQISKREIAVLDLIAKGYNSKAAAKLLQITTYTVQTHRRNMLRKTGCGNTHHLVMWAMGQGLLKV
jgi:DNA-binding CsgD family transcriptional regulator